MKLDTQVVGNMGLYYSCYRLSRLGWNVMPTARNARGIDVVAYDTSGHRFVGIQVKALSRRVAVPLGSSLDKLMGEFWIVVNDLAREPSAFVMRLGEIRKLAERSGQEGRASYWLSRKAYDCEEYREAWSRITSDQ